MTKNSVKSASPRSDRHETRIIKVGVFLRQQLLFQLAAQQPRDTIESVRMIRLAATIIESQQRDAKYALPFDQPVASYVRLWSTIFSNM